MVLSYSHFKSQTEWNFAWYFGTLRQTKSTWSMWNSLHKLRAKVNFALFSQDLINKLPKSICATQLVQLFNQNKSHLMLMYMECHELILLYAHKTIFTCGSTKAKHQGLLCSSQLVKWVTESWEDKFAGIFNKSQTSTPFMTWTNSITPKNVKMLFAQLQLANKCWSSAGKVGHLGDSLYHTSHKSQSFSGSHFQWLLESTVIRPDWLWSISQVYWIFWKSIRKEEVF